MALNSKADWTRVNSKVDWTRLNSTKYALLYLDWLLCLLNILKSHVIKNIYYKVLTSFYLIHLDINSIVLKVCRKVTHSEKSIEIMDRSNGAVYLKFITCQVSVDRFISDENLQYTKEYFFLTK